MSHQTPIKSPQYTWKAGSTFDFTDFVPLMIDGQRVVVDRFKLRITGTITVGTGTWDGRDVVRLIQLLNVEKRDGRLRWSLNGKKTRDMAIHLDGILHWLEHGTVAVGAAQAVDLTVNIPMIRPFLPKPEEWSLAPDTFKKISVTCNTLANAQTGTAVLSADALSIYVLAEYHLENYVDFKSDDIIRSVDFASNTQANLATTGTVQDALISRDDGTAGGGAAITAITDVRCEDLGTAVLSRADLVNSYRQKRKLAPASASTIGGDIYHEPAIDGTVLPVLVSDDQTSPSDGKQLDRMKWDVGTGAANLSFITREVVDKSQSDYNSLTARHNIAPSEIQLVTKQGTAPIDASKHSKKHLRVASWRAPLKKAS